MEKTILKWFEILDFPAPWRGDIEKAAKGFDFAAIDSLEKPYAALFEDDDKLKGLLYALCKCQDFYDDGIKRGIDRDILIETMQEIRRHSVSYHRNSNGERLGIYQIKWAGTVLSGKMYCLGRLEFEMKKSGRAWDKNGVAVGDYVMGLHVPRTGGPMTDSEVSRSFKLADAFFAEYFPDFDYKCYSCKSWLLDPTLRTLLPPESNIIRFLDRFDVIETEETTSGLTIIFGAGTNYENVLSKNATTSLQTAVQRHVQNGGKLLSGYGFAEKTQK